jgi:hypothetical protein
MLAMGVVFLIIISDFSESKAPSSLSVPSLNYSGESLSIFVALSVTPFIVVMTIYKNTFIL